MNSGKKIPRTEIGMESKERDCQRREWSFISNVKINLENYWKRYV